MTATSNAIRNASSLSTLRTLGATMRKHSMNPKNRRRYELEIALRRAAIKSK